MIDLFEKPEPQDKKGPKDLFIVKQKEENDLIKWSRQLNEKLKVSG